MALPVSGQISMSQVNTELGNSSTAQISLNDAVVRNLFGAASGAISLNDGHGKSSAWAGTITTNQLNLNLNTWASANGWDGSSAATVTIATGVYIWSDNTATPALTTNSFPGGLTIINNGYIMGKGGSGSVGGSVGYAGGPAISIGVNCTITNNSYIGGGGGGGGASAVFFIAVPSRPGLYVPAGNRPGGGGSGGGNGGYWPDGGIYKGIGGSIGNAGTAGTGPETFTTAAVAGGGGGRMFPGVGAAARAAVGNNARNGLGGGGGGGGAGWSGSGSAGGSNGGVGGVAPGGHWGGGGGGWGASGGSGASPAGGSAGGAGGKAIALNGYSATINSSGSIWGSVS